MINIDFKLGVSRGVYNGETFKNMMSNPAFAKLTQIVSKESINPKKLVKGRINGYVADAISGIQDLKDMGLQDQVEIHPFTIHSSNVYVMLSKKSTSQETVDKFNQSLETLKTNGKQQAVISKYLN